MSNKDDFSNVDIQKIFAASLYMQAMGRLRHDREYAKMRRLTAIIFCVSILLNIGLIIWLFWLFNWWIALLVGLVIFIIIILLSIWNIFSPSVEDLWYADMVRRTINEMSAKEKSDKEPMNTNEDGKTDNDTNKLNGDDWVRLLKVFPQFAQYCNWEKLSRKNWIDLLEAHPEFADKCGDIQLIYDVFAEAQNKLIQRDIEALIESQNIERKERLWKLIPLGIFFLFWGVGCIAFYCERVTDMALIIWWTVFCSWNGVYYSLRKKNPESKRKWDLANVIAWILLVPCSIIGYMIYRGVF